jgi:hypothetical protein
MRSLTIPALALVTLAGFAQPVFAQQQQQQQPSQRGAQAQGMDMNAFMARCAQLRQQSGTSQTAQARQVLDQCDQMDRSMGMTPPPRR